MSDGEMMEVMRDYERQFTDLFTQMYERMGGDVSGVSCERVGPDVVSAKGGELFVSFKVW